MSPMSTTPMPQTPSLGFEDPNDPRWRLIRPTLDEPLWIAVRPLPRHTTAPVTLQKLRFGSTRTLVIFDAEHLTPAFLQAFAARAGCAWHPHRVDSPQELPAAWRPAVRALVHPGPPPAETPALR